MTADVRRATVEDLPRLLVLLADHAAYERASFAPEGKLEALRQAMSGRAPRLMVWVAEHRGELVGYASASFEYSTWAAAEYLHMDCLYLAPAARGQGLGARLLDAVLVQAGARGVAETQWQTPDWNDGAIRFYLREGARPSAKIRFVASPR